MFCDQSNSERIGISLGHHLDEARARTQDEESVESSHAYGAGEVD